VAREDDDVYVCGVVTAGDPLGFIAGFGRSVRASLSPVDCC
jgi:hypothetical protein